MMVMVMVMGMGMGMVMGIMMVMGRMEMGMVMVMATEDKYDSTLTLIVNDGECKFGLSVNAANMIEHRHQRHILRHRCNAVAIIVQTKLTDNFTTLTAVVVVVVVDTIGDENIGHNSINRMMMSNEIMKCTTSMRRGL